MSSLSGSHRLSRRSSPCLVKHIPELCLPAWLQGCLSGSNQWHAQGPGVRAPGQHRAARPCLDCFPPTSQAILLSPWDLSLQTHRNCFKAHPVEDTCWLKDRIYFIHTFFHMPHLCGVPEEVRRGQGSFRVELQGDVSPPYGCWEPDLGLGEEQQVLFVAEHLWTPSAHLKINKIK